MVRASESLSLVQASLARQWPTAGTGITKLTKMLGMSLPIAASPAIFIRYTSQPNLVHTLISSPEMEVRQTSDGALLAAEDYLDDTLENQPEAMALRTARTIQNELHGVVSIHPERACVGLRPMPVDGIPIIGYLPKVGSSFETATGLIRVPTCHYPATQTIHSATLHPTRLTRY